MSFILTEPAAGAIQRNLTARGHGLGIRLVVAGADCAGLAYQLTFVDDTEDDDLVFEGHGARVFIDRKSILYLTGAELDYRIQGEESGFVVNNPNVKSHCGCGESFHV